MYIIVIIIILYFSKYIIVIVNLILLRKVNKYEDLDPFDKLLSLISY